MWPYCTCSEAAGFRHCWPYNKNSLLKEDGLFDKLLCQWRIQRGVLLDGYHSTSLHSQIRLWNLLPPSFHWMVDSYTHVLIQFVQPYVCITYNVDAIDILYILHIYLRYQILRYIKMAAWWPFFIFGNYILCSNSKNKMQGFWFIMHY